MTTKTSEVVVFSAEVGQRIQRELRERFQESKLMESPGEIEEAMAGLCADVMQMVTGWTRIGKRAVFGEGCVLHWVEKTWPDLEPLHAQFDSFHEFATQQTGEEYSTFRSKIAVYRTYILNEDNVARIAEIGPDAFLDVPLGKLQKARGAIRRSEMTDDQWDALVDPQISDRHFYQIMKQDEVPSGPDDDDENEELKDTERLTVDMASGRLTLWRGEGQIGMPIGYLDVNSQETAIREAVDAVIESAKIDRVN